MEKIWSWSWEAELGVNAELGRNSTSGNSSTEINRLSSETNSTISREMDKVMNSVSVQIQRAIDDAISSQVLPQIQNALMAGTGNMTQKGWNVPTEGPEIDPEVLRSEIPRNNLKSERVRNRLNDEPMDNAYDTGLVWNFERYSLSKNCVVFGPKSLLTRPVWNNFSSFPLKKFDGGGLRTAIYPFAHVLQLLRVEMKYWNVSLFSNPLPKFLKVNFLEKFRIA